MFFSELEIILSKKGKVKKNKEKLVKKIIGVSLISLDFRFFDFNSLSSMF